MHKFFVLLLAVFLSGCPAAVVRDFPGGLTPELGGTIEDEEVLMGGNRPTHYRYGDDGSFDHEYKTCPVCIARVAHAIEPEDHSTDSLPPYNPCAPVELKALLLPSAAPAQVEPTVLLQSVPRQPPATLPTPRLALPPPPAAPALTTAALGQALATSGAVEFDNKSYVSINKARKAAEVKPLKKEGGIFEFVFHDGDIYRIAAATYQLTMLRLQPGEELRGTPYVGDSSNWRAEGSVTRTPDGQSRQTVIIISPNKHGAKYTTNMIVVTDQRTYMLKLLAHRHTFYPSVRWTYPAQELRNLTEKAAQAQADLVEEARKVGLKSKEQAATANIYTRYEIKSRRRKAPQWMPIQVFDDGKFTFIDFSPNVRNHEVPTFYILHGRHEALTNYYVVDGPENRIRYVVHRLFERAALRLITNKRHTVFITRLLPGGTLSVAPPPAILPQGDG